MASNRKIAAFFDAGDDAFWRRLETLLLAMQRQNLIDISLWNSQDLLAEASCGKR
jgi:hypothetical protein